MIVAEPADLVLFGQLRLSDSRFLRPEVVEPKVSGDVRLVMPPKEGFSACHIGPFGKTFAPPGVIFRNGVKLGEIEADNTIRHLCFFHPMNIFNTPAYYA